MIDVNGNIENISPIGIIENVEVIGYTTIISAKGVAHVSEVTGHLGIGLIERGTTDHSQLDNLDYEHSGHTGFASEERLNEVEAQIPKNTSDLENDSGFITNITNSLINYYLKSETYTKTEVNNLISQIQSFHYEIVQELPQIGANNILYLVPRQNTETNNIYDEYVYANNSWEKIGSTEIDLMDYVKNTDYANGSKGGVFKTSSSFAITVTSGGYLVSSAKTYNDYQSGNVNMFISKGTLENVITGKHLVSDSDYVHTDNNFDDGYMTKLDNIVDDGDGNSFLSDDGTYKSIDVRIPNINIKSIIKDGEKFLRLEYGAYSKAFEDYVKTNGIQIHLLRYKYCTNRTWQGRHGDVKRSQDKKWIHPSNVPITIEPNKQCWGFGCYQRFMEQEDYFDQIENADYYIANNGIVQSEFTLNYSSFKHGFLDINVRDLMSCIVKKGGAVSSDDIDMKIPSYGDGKLVKIMGTRTSPRRKRVRQPIKYVFALPVRTTTGQVKYQYGNSNEAILELMTLRDSRAMKSYAAGDKLLPDIGFGVLIK